MRAAARLPPRATPSGGRSLRAAGGQESLGRREWGSGKQLEHVGGERRCMRGLGPEEGRRRPWRGVELPPFREGGCAPETEGKPRARVGVEPVQAVVKAEKLSEFAFFGIFA